MKELPQEEFQEYIRLTEEFRLGKKGDEVVTTEPEGQSEKAQKLVQGALESQGGRHSRDKVNALTEHLMGGGKPRTYGERFAQMALERAGLIARSS